MDLEKLVPEQMDLEKMDLATKDLEKLIPEQMDLEQVVLEETNL